jgi:hypothetical protein
LRQRSRSDLSQRSSASQLWRPKRPDRAHSPSAQIAALGTRNVELARRRDEIDDDTTRQLHDEPVAVLDGSARRWGCESPRDSGSLTGVTRHAAGLVVVALLGCNREPVPEAQPLPESMRGNWAQKPEQLLGAKTVGLVVEDKVLRFSELTLTIVDGKEIGSGNYQVGLAEVVWEKNPKVKRCSGTIGVQGTTLLVKLYEQGSETPCESALQGDWRGLKSASEVPEAMRGTFGMADAESDFAGVGFTLGKSDIAFTDDPERIAIEGLYAWADKPTEAFVSAAKYRGKDCLGTLAIEGDKAQLTLVERADPTANCVGSSGVRWTVDTRQLPSKIVTNGKVDVTIAGDRVTVVTKDEMALRCELPILRTDTRSSSESQWRGVPVTGGTIAVLGADEPKHGAAVCRKRLDNLAKKECEEELGAPCDQETWESFADVTAPLCPGQIVVGDPLASGRKIALLPQSKPVQACFDMTGDFK